MARVRVASLSELEDGGLRRVEADGEGIVLARVGDRVFALCDTCSHAEASLSEGELYAEDLEIECPLHSSSFHLETGDPTEPPATKPVARYDVVIEGDEVSVEV